MSALVQAKQVPEFLELPIAPSWLQALRVVLLVALFAFAGFWLLVGTHESRVLYFILFFLGFANFGWGVLALAIIAPMMLQDVGKIHLLMAADVSMMGMLAGALREWKPGVRPRRGPVVHFGVWGHYLLGLFVLLLASSLVGLQLVWLRESFVEGISGAYWRFVMMFTGSASEPEWALRSLWNWTTGMLLAVVAAHRMDEVLAARWLKMGAIGLTVACVFGLLDWASIRFPGWTQFDLSHLRRLNPDPVQIGRLQGTAGHPGWFAQWIVLMWPGLLLWWSPGSPKRNVVIVAAIVACGLALVLSAARAGWLGMAVSLTVAFVFMARHYPSIKSRLPWIIGGGVLLIALSLMISGQYLWFRLENILRTDDRANYYVTGLLFLREYPFGLGLGTHFRFYGWMIPPGYRWGQVDYVDSHNLLLHTLIENGPFVPLMIILGAVGMALELRRAWPRLTMQEKEIVGCITLALIGGAVVSVAQYIVYIRVVELALWLMAGTLVGICRHRSAVLDSRAESPLGRRLLLACGVGAALMASMNAGRVYADQVPRIRETDAQGRLSIWTGTHWRVAIEPAVDEISFDLYRRGLDATVRVIWPDGRTEVIRIEPGPKSAPIHERHGHASLSFTRPSREGKWYSATDWLRLEVTPLWTPSNILPDATDDRGLGVYISNLRISSPRQREHERQWEEEALKAAEEKKKAHHRDTENTEHAGGGENVENAEDAEKN